MSEKINRAMVVSAYTQLLHLPPASPSRLRLQSTLAALRDEIAELDGMSSEDVQNKFEELVNSGNA